MSVLPEDILVYYFSHLKNFSATCKFLRKHFYAKVWLLAETIPEDIIREKTLCFNKIKISTTNNFYKTFTENVTDLWFDKCYNLEISPKIKVNNVKIDVVHSAKDLLEMSKIFTRAHFEIKTFNIFSIDINNLTVEKINLSKFTIQNIANVTTEKYDGILKFVKNYNSIPRKTKIAIRFNMWISDDVVRNLIPILEKDAENFETINLPREPHDFDLCFIIKSKKIKLFLRGLIFGL
jgi:hypothetical protein